MKETIKKIKEHVKNNGKVYIAVGITFIVTAGITTVIMRESHAGLIDRTQRGLQDHRVHGFSPFSFNFLTKDLGFASQEIHGV
jgi:hypothetical protein